MKFSLKSRFGIIALVVLSSVLFAELTGRLSSQYVTVSACAAWPVCVPVGLAGWVQLLHRFSVGLALFVMVDLLGYTWYRFRDHRTLLPLSTSVVVVFFAEVFVGAMRVLRPGMAYLSALHSLTAIGLWVMLFSLVLAAGYYAHGQPKTFSRLDVGQRARDLFMLTKPVIVALLLMTTLGGMVAGMKSLPPFWLTFWTLVGGALAAGGASALNQYIDIDLDRVMQRTSNRPLSSGRILPAEGLAFGLALSVISFYLLAGFVNLLAAILGLAGIVYYVWLYSILLKKATVQNIVIGGGAGAIPPLVGWAAATGSLSLAAWLLFAIIFLWTPPHFWALSIVRRKDYERAGVPMLPVIQGETAARKQIWLYTIILVAVSLMLPILHLTGTIFSILSLLLGAWLLSAAWKVYRGQGNKTAWQMYRYSSMYLLFIFMALVIDALVIL
jgi:heme o synthase